MKAVVLLGCLFIIIVVFYVLAKRNDGMRKVFALLSVISLIVFVIWRGLFTLPFTNGISTVVGIVFYIAEIIGLIVFSFFISLIYNYKYDCNAKPEDVVEDDYQPKVDVFICTYNEDIKLVMATAHAAKALPYQNKVVHVCDDGHRDDLKTICERFGLSYLSRSDNEHAKAGNINYALSKTVGELFVVLDADFIVKKHFLFRSVRYFKDEKVALVQFPQTFYNKDPFQLMNPSLYNEQELFMRFFEPALANNNALIHVGTNAAIRRSALESIGGLPTKSITEDMATGLLLQNKGYKTLYINEVYALGITPHNVKDLADQRRRWARGTMQIFKYYKPSKLTGLTYKQKFCYYNCYIYWMTSIQKLIYMLVPTLFMMFDIFVVDNTLNEWLLMFIPPMILIVLSFRLYVPSIRTMTTSHIYDSFVAPIHAGAILKELFKEEKKFKVTKKDIRTQGWFDFKTVRPHILIAIWISIATIVALIKIALGNSLALGYLVTVGWSMYNLYGLLFAIAAAKSRNILSDADALSIEIEEEFICDEQSYQAYRFNYNGFRLQEMCKREYSSFEKGLIYEFSIPDFDFPVTTRCLDIQEGYAVFIFENVSLDAALELAKFYSERLHAAKPVDMCV